MKKKQLLAVIFIISLLAVALLWGGKNKVVIPLSPDEIGQNAGLIDDALNSKGETTSGEDLTKEYEEATDVEIKHTEKKDINIEEDKQQESKEEIKGDNSPKKETEKENPIDPKLEKEKIIEEDNKNKDKKDKYFTDPVPEGKPKPVEWQDIIINKGKEFTCTLSITCKSILNNMHLFNMDKLEVLPEDGIIYKTQTVAFFEGESVFDVLLREMKNNKIHMEFVMTPIYNSNYVEGINNLYEFDCGELSGWMYKVNGWFPNYGCSRYVLKDGDVIEWIYTCDLGRDIGGGWAVTGGEE